MRSKNKFLIFLIGTFFLSISYLSLGNEKDYSFLIKKGMKYFKGVAPIFVAFFSKY